MGAREDLEGFLKLRRIFKKTSYGPPENNNGVALIMVLWVVTILSVVVLEFSSAMRTEVNITRNFQEELQLYAMAKGGVERAIAELVYKNDSRVQLLRRTLKIEEVLPDQREWMADGREYQQLFDRGSCTIRIMGEAGKININLVSETMLRKIVTHLGLEGEARDVIVDSLLDWRDPDDFYRLNGAENDFYRSLKEPYDCKNGSLDSVEELLLVRGVTPGLFYGQKETRKSEEGSDRERTGLKEIFSVYAPGEQIDINSATLPVLRFVWGIPGEVAKRIIKVREEKNFENQQDLLQRVPELIPFIQEMGRYILFRSPTSYYTVEAQAKGKERDSLRNLKAIIKIDSREKEGYKIVQWLDAFS